VSDERSRLADRRLPSGGRLIDRTRPIRFTFDGREMGAFVGDTLASALLANGIRTVADSIYRGRPRGLMAAGSEEPNALVQVRSPGGASEPMLRATRIELVDGLAAERLPGKGRLIASAETGRYDKRYVHTEVLVIGAGRAGLAAAATAMATAPDARVILIDEGSSIDPADAAAAGLPVEDRPELRLLPRTTALGIYDHGYVTAVERRPNARTEGRLWHIRAGRIVLATGATERPIVFANDDRPGIMLAGAVRTYLADFAVRPGDRAVIFTTNDTTDAVADDLAASRIELVATIDARRGEVVVDTLADEAGHLARVRTARLGPDGAVDPTTVRTFEADLLLVSGGWNPNVALWSQGRGTLRFDDRIAAFVPDRHGPFGSLEVVGAAAGDIADLGDVAPSWVVPPLVPATLPADDELWSDHFVDLQRDATVRDLRRALGAGLDSIEHIKRYTTIGTAADQGKTSGVVASAIAAALLGQDVGSVGVPTYRPPYVPVSFGQLAGRDRADLLDPIRTTAIQPWHLANGAIFEDVGQWKRPRYFPQAGESMGDAVLRECRAAREGVAVMDASTLGKIDLQGPDVGVFLDRVYTNGFSRLAIGACRYGLMCRVDGMVFDDGVTSRLADDRFHMTTTTGNAAPVLDHLEEWLQTEWPELRVHATSVTEQWATVAIVGPRSRDVLRTLAPELASDADAFPFMTWRDAVVAGIAARVFRISFSGELAYEINVPAWSGLAIWEAVMAAGAAHGITPYGTEAMHVLRAEKAYPIVGQETDGSVTPQDLGMGWVVSKTKPFIGSRSHRRPDTARPDRKQLVALLPIDPDALLPEGVHLVAPDARLDQPPVPMLGHVTSSYRSAALGRTFALAMIRSGRERIGQTVLAPLTDGTTIAAVIVEPVVYDPDNLRRDGDGR
jgi:sarcosine oxidase, subunit alpha